MFQRIGALAVLVIAIAACSGTPTAGTPTPGATDTPGTGATDTPGTGETPGGQTNPPAGDLEATARALVPPGSTETGVFEAAGFFQLTLTSTMSLDDLEAFWDQKVRDLGLTEAGKFTAAGLVTYGFTNPAGGTSVGISATADEASGGVVIGITVGTSS